MGQSTRGVDRVRSESGGKVYFEDVWIDHDTNYPDVSRIHWRSKMFVNQIAFQPY